MHRVFDERDVDLAVEQAEWELIPPATTEQRGGAVGDEQRGGGAPSAEDADGHPPGAHGGQAGSTPSRGAAAADEAAEVEDNEDGSGDGDGIGGLPAEGFELDPSDTPPDLRLDPTKLQQLKVQMDAIHVVMRTTAGPKTYRTSWKKYDAWHLASFGVQGPRCQFSGLLFMSRTMATRFIRYMASPGCGSSYQQVCVFRTAHRVLHGYATPPPLPRRYPFADGWGSHGAQLFDPSTPHPTSNRVPGPGAWEP